MGKGRHKSSRRKSYSKRITDKKTRGDIEAHLELEAPDPTIEFPNKDFGNSGNLLEGPPQIVGEGEELETDKPPDLPQGSGAKERSS